MEIKKMSLLRDIESLSKDIKDIGSLRKFLVEFLGTDVKIFLVGSRARKDHTEFSDIDIVIDSVNDIQEKITLLKFILEESNLPQKVDIIYLKEAPYFKEIVEKEGVRWN